MLTAEDIQAIEKLIKKHRPEIPGHTLLIVLALLFLNGCFKGCGY